MELELEKQWIEAAKEKDKLEHELKVKTIELEMLKLNNNSTTTSQIKTTTVQPNKRGYNNLFIGVWKSIKTDEMDWRSKDITTKITVSQWGKRSVTTNV